MRNDKVKCNYKVFFNVLVTIIIIFIISRIFYYIFNNDFFKTVYITCITIFLHIIIRTIIGESTYKFCKNINFNYNSFWFKEYEFEKKLYDFLHIKDIKLFMITAKPQLYDLCDMKFEDVIHNMTVAEITHEINIFASFIPCLLINIYSSPKVFIVTSVIASLIDLLYVFIQRYNRPRLMKLLSKYNSLNENKIKE